MKRFLLSLAFVAMAGIGCGAGDLLSQNSASTKVRNGNEFYARGDFDEALIRYSDAEIDAPDDARIRFNVGNALYRVAKFPEAEAAYLSVTTRGDELLKADAHYNLGNALFRQGRFDRAAESYQRCLELNPADMDAKFNLELVLKMLDRAAQQAEPSGSTQQRSSNWARERMKEAEGLAQQGRYGAAVTVISRTFQAEPVAASEFGDFATRVRDLRGIFGEGR